MGYLEVVVDPTLLAFEIQVLPWVLIGMLLIVLALAFAMLAAWGCILVSGHIRSFAKSKRRLPKQLPAVNKRKAKTA